VNAFYKVHEWRTVPTPNSRVPETGEINLTSKQRNRYELASGTKGRSGEQIDIWSAVFGPLRDDGAQLLRLMAQRIMENRPAGTRVDWTY